MVGFRVVGYRVVDGSRSMIGSGSRSVVGSRRRRMVGSRGRGVVWGGWVSHIGGGRCWMGWKGGHVGMDGAVVGRGGCHAGKESHELKAYHRYPFLPEGSHCQPLCCYV